MGQFKISIEYLPDMYSILQNKIAIQAVITEECIKDSTKDVLEYSAKRSIEQFVREFECEVDNLRYNPNRNSSMKSTYDHNYGNRYA